uniref:MFS domain-containing protein n=1 Tax=Meloidogyne hapla TaxID=6305 RepID=A0A1I8BTX0_MELHA
MPITGILCNSSYGWPSAYYLFGLLCLILFILFFIIYRDWPHQSSLISQKEALLISKNQQKKKKDERVPYIKMLTDKAVWACIFVAISSGLSYWLFAQYGPLYMHEVLNYNVDSTGIWIAVPYFASIFSKLSVPLIEYFPKISLKFKIVGITFICQLINVLCYLVLGIWPSSSHLIAQTALIVVLSANGAGFVGLASNSQVIARQHAHFILSLVALINYVITLIQPIIIAWIASSKNHEELANDWSRVFFAYGAISFVLNTLFFFGAGTEARPWTEQNPNENKKENKNENVVCIEKL